MLFEMQRSVCLFGGLCWFLLYSAYVLPLLVRISYVQMEELLHTALQQLRVLAVWYLGAFASLALLSFIMKKKYAKLILFIRDGE